MLILLEYKIRNPCKKCLVKPACTDRCQEYFMHLHFLERLTYYWNWSLDTFSDGLAKICYGGVILLVAIALLITTTICMYGLGVLCEMLYNFIEGMVI